MKSGRSRLRCPGGDVSAKLVSAFGIIRLIPTVRHRSPYHAVPVHLFASIDWSAFLLGDNHVCPVPTIYSSFLC